MLFKTLRVLALGAALLVLGGCAGAQVMKDKPQPQATGDTAMIYFYRESHFKGAAVVYDIKDGDKTVGILQSGTYFYYPATPGDHTFSASTEASTSLPLHVEAGKTYYVRGSVSMGAFVGHPKLEVTDANSWQTQFADLKYAVKQEPTKH